MITLSGQLAIRSVIGRNGAFNVAKLATTIGEFSIKDAVLDQYEEGKYQGDFVISQIKPSYYCTRSGTLIVETRAYLESMTLDEKDALSREEAAAVTPSVQDPAEEEATKPKPPVPKPAKAESTQADATSDDDTPFGMTAEELTQQGIAAGATARPASPKTSAGSPSAAETAENTDAELFGLLWPLGETVKLDATVERLTQRKQVERLKALGFVLDFKQQLWLKQQG